jgi:DHA2 family methylenomycin A resistance protein-like MFS transporter
VLNTARQAGGAIGVAAFGALASASDAAQMSGAAHVVAGLKASTLISSCLLRVALGLACLVHPQAHARKPAREGGNGARSANASR